MSASYPSVSLPGQKIAPFSICLLESFERQHQPLPDLAGDRLAQLLPASYSSNNVELLAPRQDVGGFIKKELSLSRLNDLDDWLWLAGQLRLPRPLHQQFLLGRALCITEYMDMHLLWTSGKLFIKPCPRYLLDPHFWTKYLRCGPDTDCALEKGECRVHPELWRSALGFLFSYTALIRHPSDFKIARDYQLIPSEVEWICWVEFVQQVNSDGIHARINPRFCHGELRLNRLNKLHQLLRNPLRGYAARWDEYSAFFNDNFAWLAGATVYIAIVLTAMQVGQSTDALGTNRAFQSATFGFTVFSILGPLIIGVLIVVLFCLGIIYNWMNTVNRRAHRLEETHCGHPHGIGWWRRRRERIKEQRI